jgi:hypothetical protein
MFLPILCLKPKFLNLAAFVQFTKYLISSLFIEGRGAEEQRSRGAEEKKLTSDF